MIADGVLEQCSLRAASPRATRTPEEVAEAVGERLRAERRWVLPSIRAVQEVLLAELAAEPAAAEEPTPIAPPAAFDLGFTEECLAEVGMDVDQACRIARDAFAEVRRLRERVPTIEDVRLLRMLDHHLCAELGDDAPASMARAVDALSGLLARQPGAAGETDDTYEGSPGAADEQ